jgi:hypothetical protein
MIANIIYQLLLATHHVIRLLRDFFLYLRVKTEVIYRDLANCKQIVKIA